MSQPLSTVHKCECKQGKRTGYLHNDAIFCNKCDGLIAHVSDYKLDELNRFMRGENIIRVVYKRNSIGYRIPVNGKIWSERWAKWQAEARLKTGSVFDIKETADYPDFVKQNPSFWFGEMDI